MKLTLGFSPCPNDTFIFDALVNKKIDTGEFEFNVLLRKPGDSHLAAIAATPAQTGTAALHQTL